MQFSRLYIRQFSKVYDAVVVGGGSVGVCVAQKMAEDGLKPLVIEEKATTGQGQNKRAIGGVRATHGTPGKILTCLRSLEIFSNWKEERGDDIEWHSGGYMFPLYREQEDNVLSGLLEMQKSVGLNIDRIEPEQVEKLVPGINMEGLRGGIYSPEDGHCSPMLSGIAFKRAAMKAGAEFHFDDKGVKLLTDENGVVNGVETENGEKFIGKVVVDCTGGFDLEQPLLTSQGLTPLPLHPDCHEAGITEPVADFFKTMIVDLRPGDKSKNFYFYQNTHGQVIFCITPDPAILGVDERETSEFLPMITKRMIDVIPRLKNLSVRRVWRGIYPMSPDGSPLVGWNKEIEGLFHATAMCGQGFMLGPGLGETVARTIVRGKDDVPSMESEDKLERDDATILDEFNLYREFKGMEALK
eukprot:TRINITY_DN779828_c0_g1_i1.p1 TRINITY_DN779828_c0_g1~~TRINITY_DN779828_c0_g1_i1.p1  ORF type:complete len:412 (+),score=124.94 TRINITY_DN779828_c0_g1_i1:170-1405(+)